MPTELTFAILKYGYLILLWVFLWLVVRSLRRDIETFSPRKSLSSRRRDRKARKAAKTATSAPAAVRQSSPVRRQSVQPSLLVVIDGPLAGSSVPLGNAPITLGRAASNTVVLDDEFVSSHHARVYPDPSSGSWIIEDLGSTNGTVVNQRRISVPTVLAARVPVRIGATTFELR
ncbi:FHA domain-containing protein FhaB/FipA [Bifidobacterium boum]|uniref:FHA domain-containing protein FhaB/FipA n=1 Tax=Bifidobacterium boum TaxID=78343 RepID=UPI003F9334CF